MDAVPDQHRLRIETVLAMGYASAASRAARE
jgi:hypothetical protein